MVTPSDEILIHVHYPVPEGAKIVLRSDADWDRDVHAESVRDEPGRYAFRLKTEEPFVYFKAALVQGEDVRWSAGPNRLATTGSARIVDLFPMFDPSSARIGELERLVDGDREYRFRVFVPAGYDENTLHHYPVLYMNDGPNLFHRHEAAAGTEWGVQDTLHELDEMTSIEQVIVVGIYPRDRMEDYTRKGSEAYIRFLADKLVPHIDASYRTLRGPSHTAIMGSSLGGVSALDAAWSRPDRIGMAACLSASFGYEDDLKRRVLEGERPDVRVYLDSGWPRDNFEVTRDMRARLVRAGLEEGRSLLYFAFPGDRHSESHWGDRCHLPMQFFFGHRSDARSRAGKQAARNARA